MEAGIWSPPLFFDLVAQHWVLLSTVFKTLRDQGVRENMRVSKTYYVIAVSLLLMAGCSREEPKSADSSGNKSRKIVRRQTTPTPAAVLEVTSASVRSETTATAPLNTETTETSASTTPPAAESNVPKIKIDQHAGRFDQHGPSFSIESDGKKLEGQVNMASELEFRVLLRLNGQLIIAPEVSVQPVGTSDRTVAQPAPGNDYMVARFSNSVQLPTTITLTGTHPDFGPFSLNVPVTKYIDKEGWVEE